MVNIQPTARFIFAGMKRSLLIYGLVLGILLLLLRMVEYHFLIMYHTWEVYAGLIAVMFTVLGIWMGGKLKRPQTVVVEKVQEVPVAVKIEPDPGKIRELGLSTRELEVLEAMSHGYSNQEIADRLCVSLNTVKTHASNVFAKLEVSRRTQAIQKGKQLGIIA